MPSPPQRLEYLLEDTKVATRGGRQPAFTCSMVVWRDGSSGADEHSPGQRLWNESAARIDRQVVDVDSASFVSVLIPAEHIRAVGLPTSGTSIGTTTQNTRCVYGAHMVQASAARTAW